MQILVIYRKPVRFGFSLLELMVVLVLLGGITSLALPNLTQLYESISLKLERDAIIDQLQSLGAKALSTQEALIIPLSSFTSADRGQYRAASGNYRLHAIDLPDGWLLEFDRDLIVRANGVCLGADVVMFYQGKEYMRMQLTAPYCHVSDV
ncbi:MAG: prepilin-type N-terminal cleavage/methylation domain-containing protein [Pseudomonadales bacterium]|nr:prepilin-type N-terminal cleavage/methylation domain-containing protein [Pseudomonadales bacterium]